MIGCVSFATLSVFLGINLAMTSFDKYGIGVRCGFIGAQRDALFKIIRELRPRLRADQVEAAAKASNLTINNAQGALRVIGGIEFTLAGAEISDIRSSNF